MPESHLPECPSAPYPIGDQVCICDRLRACEQRVREEEQSHVIGSVSLAAIGEANAQAHRNGYVAGLSAARDAVVREFGPPRLHPDWQNCDDRDHSCYLLQDALAAIDALRDEA